MMIGSLLANLLNSNKKHLEYIKSKIKQMKKKLEWEGKMKEKK